MKKKNMKQQKGSIVTITIIVTTARQWNSNKLLV